MFMQEATRMAVMGHTVSYEGDADDDDEKNGDDLLVYNLWYKSKSSGFMVFVIVYNLGLILTKNGGLSCRVVL